MFDFDSLNFETSMQVEENYIEHFRRFDEVTVPKWMGVNIKPTGFGTTPYVNNLQALIHFNQ